MALLYWILAIVIISLALYFFAWYGCDPAKISPNRFIYDIEENEKKISTVTDTKEKWLIIGTGFSGLGLAGALKRHAIPFDAIEKQDKVGGNWYSGVYNHVHILSSRATTEFKDFPMPNSYPDFPSGPQMCQYLKSYAQYFGLEKHIEFKTECKLARPIKGESGPYKDNYLWEVHLSNGEKRIYKGIICCIGHHWSKRIPKYPGQETFSGTIIHSKDYKNNDIFVNKKVLVVGGGNSACDINVEAARFAQETHSSMRRGYWFLPRTLFGVPFVELLYPWIPLWLQRLGIRFLLRILFGKYSQYGLQEPDHKIFEMHPTINTEFLNYIKLGIIKPHPDIKRFDDKTVEFLDGTKEDFDLVVFATGYNHELPMFEPGLIEYDEGIPQLVSALIHPKYENLFIFGLQQPRYGAGPLITLGGELVSLLIQYQAKLKYPISKIMIALGQNLVKRNNAKNSLRTDILQDPHVICQRVLLFTFLIPKLSLIEKILEFIGRLK